MNRLKKYRLTRYLPYTPHIAFLNFILCLQALPTMVPYSFSTSLKRQNLAILLLVLQCLLPVKAQDKTSDHSNLIPSAISDKVDQLIQTLKSFNLTNKDEPANNPELEDILNSVRLTPELDPGSSTLVATMAPVINRLFSSHPIIVSRYADLESYKKNLVSAKLQFLPTPSVSVEQAPVSTTQNSPSLAQVLRLSQPLFTGGKLTSDLKIAQLRIKFAENEINDAKSNLALKFFSLYQNWWAQVSRLKIYLRALEQTQSLYDMIKRRVNAGVSAEVDLGLSEIRLLQAKVDVEVAKSAAKALYDQLSTFVGSELPLEIVSVDQITPLEQSFSEIWAWHEATDSNIARTQLQTQQGLIEVEQIESSLWPTLNLRIERQWGATNLAAPYAANQVRYYISANASPGAGLSVLSNIDSARNRIISLESEAVRVKREILEKLVSEWQDYLSIQQRLPFLRKSLEESQSMIAANLRLFVAGRRSWIDLMNSVREQTDSFIRLSDSQAFFVGSHLRWLWFSGQLHFNEAGYPNSTN
ncbi:MAG: TolC family protein [Gammaproteobacteria bacterium]|nr:TolC family protein [Gammaproteobacteria bacterium]